MDELVKIIRTTNAGLIALLLNVFLCAHLIANSDAFILEIEKSLMAPCCWSGTVYDHGNSEMEKDIKRLVHEGKSKEEIFQYFVNEKRIVMSDGRIKIGYGEKILAVPVASGFNLLVWVMPAALGIAAFLVIGLTIKQRPKIKILDNTVQKSNIQFDDAIEKELKELE